MLTHSLTKREHHQLAFPCLWPRPRNSKGCASIFIGIKHIEISTFIAKKGLFFEAGMMYESVLSDEH
jgi:hypothetical protein